VSDEKGKAGCLQNREKKKNLRWSIKAEPGDAGARPAGSGTRNKEGEKNKRRPKKAFDPVLELGGAKKEKKGSEKSGGRVQASVTGKRTCRGAGKERELPKVSNIFPGGKRRCFANEDLMVKERGEKKKKKKGGPFKQRPSRRKQKTARDLKDRLQ